MIGTFSGRAKEYKEPETASGGVKFGLDTGFSVPSIPYLNTIKRSLGIISKAVYFEARSYIIFFLQM